VKLTHKDAAIVLRMAFRNIFSREPTRPERQCLQAVGWLETGYGQHWDSRGAGSNNWGAIQAHEGWSGPTFAYVDTRPNDDGTSTPYKQAFRAYATPTEGAQDLAKVVYSAARKSALVAAGKGNTHDFSAALYDTVYYQGFGRTREERIAHHLLAVNNACNAMALEIGEPLPDGSEPIKPVPVYRIGSVGDGVRAIQRFLEIEESGTFGSATATALKTWQRAHNLKPDGVWGPVCFHIVETEVTGEDVDALMGLL